MHAYRTHNCAELRKEQIGETVKLSGWVHRKRDHGGVLFIDLRDTHGLTQCVIDQDSPLLAEAEKWRAESVITVTGKVRARFEGTANSKMNTGDVELYIDEAIVQGAAEIVPLQVADEDQAGEDVRLKYRYLDLRRQGMHSRIRLRNNVISHLRASMWEQDFQEFNTPILTASSPEGARDYMVPSRLHPGKFYALPQAPQQFKQLLMVSGFDKYFQIAPCFRDEDGRADRLAEFYQLDVEMSFVTQDDVFNTMEPVIAGLFTKYNDWTGTPHKVTDTPFPRLTYKDAMMRYGSDKPDLRNPLEICDVTEVFKREDVTFNAFKGMIEKGSVVRAIRTPKVAGQSRKFFDKLNDWARGEGAPGLGYVVFSEEGEGKGPIAKFIPEAAQAALREAADLENGDAIFFICDKPKAAARFAGRARDAICDALPEDHSAARESGTYKFCWVVDYPMYERDEHTGVVDFSHNPFSMPQGGMADLEDKDPEDILAWQYDCICNGHELCSGAIRNHQADIMEKAFGIAGYDKSVLEEKFGGMLNAFQYGAPPHGGCGFGIDRMVMILAHEPNLREVYAFVMNGSYEDPMMNAPSLADAEQLKDLHLKLSLPKPKLEEAG